MIRNRRVVFAVVALVSVLLLAWWALNSREQAVPRLNEVEARHEPSINPTLVGVESAVRRDLQMSKATTGEYDAPQGSLVHVTVRGHSDDTALEGATVTAVMVDRHSVGRLLVPAGGVLARGTTDSDGHVRLAIERSDGATVRIFASAVGSASCDAAWNGEEELKLRLPAGRTISGHVLDAAARPVAGLTVRARAVEVPDMSDELVVSTASSAWRTTVSDSQGRFTIQGLWPGTYAVTAYGDGWVMSRPTRDGETEQQVHFVADTTGVALQVRPVRVFRLQIVDAVLKCPIPFTYWGDVTFTVEEAPGIELGIRQIDEHAYRLFDGRMWTTVGSSGGDPSVFVSYAELVPGSDVPTEATVFVEVPGYEGVITSVKLMTPSKLRTTSLADRIDLRPNGARGLPAGRGRVTVQETVDSGPYWRTPWRELVLHERGGKRRSAALRGRAVEPGRWEFLHVPVGLFEAKVVGGQRKRPSANIDVRVGKTTILPLSDLAREGFVLDVRDGQGDVLHGIDFLVAYAEPNHNDGIHIPATDTQPGWDTDRRIFLPRVIELPPGRYMLSAHKEGYGHAKGEVEVLARRVVTARIRFEAVARDK